MSPTISDFSATYQHFFLQNRNVVFTANCSPLCQNVGICANFFVVWNTFAICIACLYSLAKHNLIFYLSSWRILQMYRTKHLCLCPIIATCAFYLLSARHFSVFQSVTQSKLLQFPIATQPAIYVLACFGTKCTFFN